MQSPTKEVACNSCEGEFVLYRGLVNQLLTLVEKSLKSLNQLSSLSDTEITFTRTIYFKEKENLA